MTVIAYRNGIMASDSICVSGWTVLSREKKKVFRLKDGSLVGGAGMSALIESYREWLDAGSTGPRPNLHGPVDAKDSASSLLVARPDGRVELHTANGIEEASGADDFYSIGCGAELAVGAMEFGATAEQAVAVAIKRSMGCGGKIQVEHLKALAVAA